MYFYARVAGNVAAAAAAYEQLYKHLYKECDKEQHELEDRELSDVVEIVNCPTAHHPRGRVSENLLFFWYLPRGHREHARGGPHASGT